jgi:hypothetical protein
MCYTISQHARQRIAERGLDAACLAAALDGRAFEQADGHVGYCDPRSRCLVVIDPQSAVVVTAYRLQRKQLKRRYSR